jgi:hypothetical protein
MPDDSVGAVTQPEDLLGDRSTSRNGPVRINLLLISFVQSQQD